TFFIFDSLKIIIHYSFLLHSSRWFHCKALYSYPSTEALPMPTCDFREERPTKTSANMITFFIFDSLKIIIHYSFLLHSSRWFHCKALYSYP
ncbi:hypothetical protein BOQ60_25495, partial [Chryseobacterium sp. CH1]